MRLLVAGRSAKALARLAGAFSDDLTIETAATKAGAVALLRRAQFDLILACEKLDDGSGLEVLTYAVANAPDTLRIFAARPSTLNSLKGKLGLFGLFRTLPYPIDIRKVWAAVNLLRGCCVESESTSQPRQTLPVPHVVLASTRAAAIPRPTVLKPGPAVVSPRRPAPVGASPGDRPPTRIPESEAFKRALARRIEAKRRGDRSVINDSPAKLAQLGTTRRPTLKSRAGPARLQRTALFVGAVVAVGTATFLTLFMLSGNDPIGPSQLPLVAAGDRPVSGASTAQPTSTTSFVPNNTVAPATAGLDADARAGLEPFGNQPGHPGPPPPTPPPGPGDVVP